ncbi:MAG: ImmA/IrrE family metallo-endopeptidase [Melioribacteraceae bacterium]|nr:ImmA/IrrE family metallo-endopeptidase [Melioribacteraceae bacterium]
MSVLAKANAKKLLDKYCIEKPSDLNLVKIANAEFLDVRFENLDHCYGRISYKNDFGAITVSTTIKDSGQENFVLAHEMGHFYNERKKNQSVKCEGDIKMQRSGREFDANVFAAELIMHEPWFYEFTNRKKLSSELLRDIADYFKTSLSSAAMRYTELGNTPTAIILTTDGTVKYSRINSYFPYQFIRNGMTVNNNSYTSDFYNGDEISRTAEEIPIEAWFLEDFNYKKNQFIMEQNIPMPSYNSCLTILWEK